MIKLEDFKKLKQNDRIEYLLRSNCLEKRQSSTHFNWFSIVLFVFVLIGFIILLSMQFYIIESYETFITIFDLIKPLSTIIFVVTAFGILGILWNLTLELVVFKKARKELEEEFFKTETKPRK